MFDGETGRELGRAVTTLVAVCAFLVAGAACGVFAAQAQAEPSLEIMSEADFEHCPAVTMVEGQVEGGCLVHFVTDSAGWTAGWEGGGSMNPWSLCAVELDVRIDEAGNGYIYDQAFTGFQVCRMTTCEPEGVNEWPISLYERNGQLEAELQVCMNLEGVTLMGQPDIPCHMDGVPVGVTGHGPLELGATPGVFFCEDPSYWSFFLYNEFHLEGEEMSEGIEIVHHNL